ncbi:fimbria/pilus periplasmic chaperone [Pseudomonas sp. PDM32]|uniref:fimbrial biogenesis chaperone n=1 Tax=Pseudomonas sp. PDM32 TaxID=2854768 RepID=UPI001C43B5EA|nr:fimbria/pilus periplasmic chaperone [Pseudomonas sp. PDM32]MBV7576693.1 fimbria/pilus periplasmic chaperone [Pseudomonas sp. PDM32]
MRPLKSSRWLLSGLPLLASLYITQVQAAIVISGTRVIYSSDQKEVSVKLDNGGQAPLLVQSWVDDGDKRSTPDTSTAPFILTPPIARVNAGQGQTLRIRLTAQQMLPQDKESLFWLNVLEVPPSAEDGQNKLNIVFRNRIKLFYRPVGLKEDMEQAAGKMQWRLKKNVGGWALEGANATPYFLTWSTIKVGDASADLNLENSMFAPGEHKTLPLKGAYSPSGSSRIEGGVINDYGGISKLEFPILF